jgi:hypothetical protein
MKTTNSPNPDIVDHEQNLLEPASNAQSALSPKEDQNSSPVCLEIFYDGREVYGGY